MIKKGILISLFVLVYFTGIIELRNFTMNEYTKLIELRISEKIELETKSSRYLSVSVEDKSKKYVSRVSFGMNFFIGFIGLILISATKNFYFMEVGIQIVLGLIIFFSFLIGVKGSAFFLQISDMVSLYFLPLSSLFMVVLAFIQKKALKWNVINED